MLRGAFRLQWLALLLALAGCGAPDTGEALLRDYGKRLSRSLEMAATAPPETAAASPAIASAALTPLTVPADTIGLLDFLSLSDCELQVNLGRRNSHLGRNASPSQQLLLDLEFLRLAEPCQALIGDAEPELAVQLAQLAAARQAALPHLIYNAILAGPEWRLMWRPPVTLGPYPAGTGGDITDTLGKLANQVENWLDGDWRADNMAFELMLNELRSGDGGALLSAAAVQADHLQAASAQVIRSAANGSLCPFGGDTEKSRRLRNVASRYFAGAVQPWLADLQRRQTALLPPTRRLEIALQTALPESYLKWQKARDDHLALLTEVPRAHALAISELLAPCGGISPAGT